MFSFETLNRKDFARYVRKATHTQLAIDAIWSSSHTIPENLIRRRSELMVLDLLTFEVDLLGQQALLR
jgi:hypothetical protein